MSDQEKDRQGVLRFLVCLLNQQLDVVFNLLLVGQCAAFALVLVRDQVEVAALAELISGIVVDKLLQNVLLERVVSKVVDLADDLMEALLDEVGSKAAD